MVLLFFKLALFAFDRIEHYLSIKTLPLTQTKLTQTAVKKFRVFFSKELIDGVEGF
jgi:hypothetical protein